jgi:BirA family biotin operon repressor/biotin-[acetyl-CoA-carboxylase] ligase
MAGVTWPAGWNVEHVAETGSTNDDLLARLGAGPDDDRRVIVADHQTAGRGRLDRRWEAPPGRNLLVSVSFAPAPARPFRAVQLVSVATVNALEGLAGRRLDDLGVKWPNDLVVGERKLAGILAQGTAGVDAVVVGLGLNVGWAPAGAAAVVHDLATSVTPSEVLVALLSAIDELRDGPIPDLHRGRLVTLGRRVRVERLGDTLVGTAVDVDAEGRLVVVTADGSSHPVDVGDVVHVRPAGRGRPAD